MDTEMVAYSHYSGINIQQALKQTQCAGNAWASFFSA